MYTDLPWCVRLHRAHRRSATHNKTKSKLLPSVRQSECLECRRSMHLSCRPRLSYTSSWTHAMSIDRDIIGAQLPCKQFRKIVEISLVSMHIVYMVILHRSNGALSEFSRVRPPCGVLALLMVCPISVMLHAHTSLQGVRGIRRPRLFRIARARRDSGFVLQFPFNEVAGPPPEVSI
jgi:hypothetical protein